MAKYPDPREYDTPDDFYDAEQEYIAYMEYMHNQAIDDAYEKYKEENLERMHKDVYKQHTK